MQSAFKNCIRSGVITNLSHIDVSSFLDDTFPIFEEKLDVALHELDSLHIDTVFAGEFKIFKKDEEVEEVKYFNTKGQSIYQSTDLKEWFKEFVKIPIEADIEDFQEKDSGWTLKSIINLTISIKKLQHIQGGSSYCKLPDSVIKKKACLNVINSDNQCFKWRLLAALHSKDENRSNRSYSYFKYENELNFAGIDFPVYPRQIPKFGKQNNISVNVFFLLCKKEE